MITLLLNNIVQLMILPKSTYSHRSKMKNTETGVSINKTVNKTISSVIFIFIE